MSPTGLFYAYAVSCPYHWHIGYLIIFPSPKVADSWWRAITDSVESGRTEYSSIQRMSPQFYTYDSRKIDIAQIVDNDQCAKDFYGRLFFTSLGTKSTTAPAIPVINHPDYRNGSSYYIRFTEDRRKYWDIQNGYIVPSTSRRSLFTIHIFDPHKAAGVVILDDDEVHISCVENQQKKAISITSDGYCALQTGDEFSTFKFADLTSGPISARDIWVSRWPTGFTMTVLSTHKDNSWAEWELIPKN